MSFTQKLRWYIQAAVVDPFREDDLMRLLNERAQQILDVIEAADRCPHQSGELAEALRKLEGKA